MSVSRTFYGHPFVLATVATRRTRVADSLAGVFDLGRLTAAVSLVAHKLRRVTKRKSATGYTPQISPEIAAILKAAAEQTASGQEPRKHHLVPLWYLQRWAEDDMIRVTDRSASRPKSFTPNPRKAARDTDFYRIDPTAVIGGSPITFEVYLSHIEGNAKSAFEALEASDVNSLDDRQVSSILLYLGHQHTRTRSFRNRQKATLGNYLLTLLGNGDDHDLGALMQAVGLPKTAENIAAYRSLHAMLKSNPLSLSYGREAELRQAGHAANSMAGVLILPAAGHLSHTAAPTHMRRTPHRAP